MIKKSALYLIFLVFIVILISGCTSNSENYANKTYTDNNTGISFVYPENWKIDGNNTEKEISIKGTSTSIPTTTSYDAVSGTNKTEYQFVSGGTILKFNSIVLIRVNAFTENSVSVTIYKGQIDPEFNINNLKTLMDTQGFNEFLKRNSGTITNKTISIGGVNAIEFDYASGSNDTLTYRYIIFEKNGYYYLIKIYGSEKSFEKEKQGIETILNSLQIP